MWTSVDGLTWSRVPDDESVFGAAEMFSVTAGGPGLVAVGGKARPRSDDYDPAVWTSVDGLTWSRVPDDESVFGTGLLPNVTATERGLVIIVDTADLNLRLWTSEDGLTWSPSPDDDAVFDDEDAPPRSGTTIDVFGVAVGGPGLVAVGDSEKEARSSVIEVAAVWVATLEG